MLSAKHRALGPSWRQAPRAGSKIAGLSLEITPLVYVVLIVVVALIVFPPAMVGAAETSLEVYLQLQTFGIEDLAQFSVRVIEPPENLGAPRLGELINLEVVGGPSTGTEFSYVNGVASRSQTFTYVLRALATGSATIGPVTVAVGDRELTSEPVTAEVVEGSVAAPTRRRRSPFMDPFADLRSRRAPPRAEVHLRHSLSTDQVVVGQPLVATVYLDSTTASLYDFNLRTAPSYPGFWAQRLDNPEQPTPEVVEIDGTAFYRYQIVRSVLVPLKAGEIEIPAVDATIGVRTGGFFDSGQQVDRSTPIRVVEVSTRPPAPAGFTGAVGALRFSADIQPPEIEYGSSAVMTLTLEGRGNLPLVKTPEVLPACDACDVYPPEEASDVTVDSSGIHGSRTWQVTVVPQQWGRLVFDPVELSVFDPSSGRYKVQTVGPLTLDVSPPPPTPTPVVTPLPAEVAATPSHRGGEAADTAVSWLLGGAALVVGGLLGAGLTWVLTRRRSRVALPPRRRGQSPADRARVLQLTLERWWLDARSSSRGTLLEDEMAELRRDLEAVRFAPGRADHSDTVVDLEVRLKKLMRRA